ncbi:hypothetical protein CEXT_270321 [Caerostris extrusa]|uniref:Uncharacterized protein n=1 Tax=Caerostris extrusa TaxID=172846 RepID=A0AAV4S9K2_CAEEX|nr:hypothetical protein CEXT_270321 [Caerostris extrusa]
MEGWNEQTDGTNGQREDGTNEESKDGMNEECMNGTNGGRVDICMYGWMEGWNELSMEYWNNKENEVVHPF